MEPYLLSDLTRFIRLLNSIPPALTSLDPSRTVGATVACLWIASVDRRIWLGVSQGSPSASTTSWSSPVVPRLTSGIHQAAVGVPAEELWVIPRPPSPTAPRPTQVREPGSVRSPHAARPGPGRLHAAWSSLPWTRLRGPRTLPTRSGQPRL